MPHFTKEEWGSQETDLPEVTRWGRTGQWLVGHCLIPEPVKTDAVFLASDTEETTQGDHPRLKRRGRRQCPTWASSWASSQRWQVVWCHFVGAGE